MRYPKNDKGLSIIILEISVFSHTVIANIHNDQMFVLHHSQSCGSFHFTSVRINDRIKASRIQFEHLYERPGLFRSRGQQKTMIVANKSTITAFALALWKYFTDEIAGRIKHLNAGISYQDVTGWSHGNGRDVFKLTYERWKCFFKLEI